MVISYQLDPFKCNIIPLASWEASLSLPVYSLMISAISLNDICTTSAIWRRVLPYCIIRLQVLFSDVYLVVGYRT